MIPQRPEKQRWPLDLATKMALTVVEQIQPYCHRVCIAGSIRREKPDVGDIEILYIPKTATRSVPGDMFASETCNLMDAWLQDMMNGGVLTKRPSAIGLYSYGPKIKLMVYTPTGIPIDFFSTTEESWFNYLVCRTGPAESNKAIAERAKFVGQTWQPYKPGFLMPDGSVQRMDSEKDVFDHVGLPYREPKDR